MTLKLAKEIETLKDFSAQAHARQCKALNFNGHKPLIRRVRTKNPIGGWLCSGMHPNGYPAYGFGSTPEEAYIDWTYDNIPF